MNTKPRNYSYFSGEITVSKASAFKDFALKYLEWEQEGPVKIWTGREDFEGEIYDCFGRSDAIDTVRRLDDLASFRIEPPSYDASIGIDLEDGTIDFSLFSKEVDGDIRQEYKQWLPKVLQFAEEAEMNPRLLQTA